MPIFQKTQLNTLPKEVTLAVYYLVLVVEGLAVLFSLFNLTSIQDGGSLGFSSPNWLVASLMTAMVFFFLVIGVRVLVSMPVRQRQIVWFEDQLLGKERLPYWLIVLTATILIVALMLILFETRLQVKLDALVEMYHLTQGMLIWAGLWALQTMLLTRLVFPEAWSRLFTMAPTQLHRLGWILLSIGVTGVVAFYPLTLYFNLGIFHFFLGFALVALTCLAVLNGILEKYPDRSWVSEATTYLVSGVVFCASLCVYRAGTFITGVSTTPLKSYFDLLADAYLQGRLYLINPPYTHDLTFFNGNWYVANPPLVAVIMTPLVAVWGVDALNTVVFSIALAALNVALMYVLLSRLSQMGWTHLKMADNLWLTALFGFGTPQWYISSTGTMWAMSQVITITLLILAVLVMLTRNSAWASGAALALAMAARPHIILFFPILLAIRFEYTRKSGRSFGFKQLLAWGIPTGLPIAVMGLGLLGYNWARFGNIFDYGYLTENVADFMADDLKNYGTFHPHFILRNLNIMLFGLPKWSQNCNAITPTFDGLSLFLTTPALFYLLRSFKRSNWVLGAWATIVTILIPLMFYYNTGAWQFGYKYLLDFIVPVMILLAVAAGQRLSGLYRVLIMLSILIQGYGVLWFFKVICRA